MVADDLLITIADYAYSNINFSEEAYKNAKIALLDSLACAMLALDEPNCVSLLGPYVPGTEVPKGARVPGTTFELDPMKAAFDIGTCIRWLDYNDTWLAQEWGHPSDNLGCILAVGDYISQNISNKSTQSNNSSSKLKHIFDAMIKAYEIQGVLALDNSFNHVGLDHVLLVKVASSTMAGFLFDLSKNQIIDVLSQAWVDGGSLRTYRHAPSTGPRKSWAAGDAAKRGVELAWMVLRGQPGIPWVLSAKRWGFSDVLFEGKPLKLSQPLRSYVMENILFKVSYPAEFHAQTALEAAIELYRKLKIMGTEFKDIKNIEKINTIVIETQAAGFKIINKEGPLKNYADRDHCLQYIVAVGLLYGELKQDYYSNDFAKDPRIDLLRNKMIVKENAKFTQDYLDPNLRAIPNSVQLVLNDNVSFNKTISFPLGHPKRREQAYLPLKEKFNHAVLNHFPLNKTEHLLKFWDMPIEEMAEIECSQFINNWIG